MSGRKAKEELAQMRQRPVEELGALLGDKIEAYRKLRFQHALSQLREGHLLRNSRREIARLTALMSQRHQANEERT